MTAAMTITCPGCKKRLRVPASLAGRAARCPACHQAMKVGAFLPPLVAWFVVAPLKGRPLPNTAQAVLISFLVNAAWGVGTWAVASGLERLRGREGSRTAPTRF